MNIDFFDPSLLAKYDTSGPRYTSYPTALEFTPTFTEQAFIQAAQSSSNDTLSLYVHIPFCHSLCYYCGCNKIVTRHSEKADKYLAFLQREIAYRGNQLSAKPVTQLHLGGGTPSFLNPSQMKQLMSALHQAFDIQPQAEISIEIDPRKIPLNYIKMLADSAFTRLSIGVQDTDLNVQRAINRVQSTAFIKQLVEEARRCGFVSINLDLIYGLPHQNEQTFATTLDTVASISPDRVSLFSYAHMPQRFAAQRKIRNEWLPDANQKLALMRQAALTLNKAGYVLIGLDHFARADDELSIAQEKGDMHRNFQGYTTQKQSDLLGLGLSAISAIGNCYSQNKKTLQDYYVSIESSEHAIDKGLVLNADDVIRRDVIQALMCNLRVDKQLIAEKYGIDFDRYFTNAIVALTPFIDDQLVINRPHSLEVVPKARLLVRNICLTFDVYSQEKIAQQRFSRVI
ncbi:oxygen-independent coproporphyrinogen III oxidase [Aestuariibacter salexigens]|uniref:oxygen-independent coproporphyrinogen III oxidase n=1 Tax=Aestuariibacter salexigens TaxID=226010 RepID=UPI00041C6BB5|nr:oxygen-independent coproporphyrinogen III oxidase [Aestuariibacter salexigens]